MSENDSIQKEIPDELVNVVANTVFSNLKLYIDQKFKELEEFFITLDDTKINIATLSTILHTKELFTQEEYQDCFKEIRNSFGVVNPDGTMDGKVQVTCFNF